MTLDEIKTHIDSLPDCVKEVRDPIQLMWETSPDLAAAVYLRTMPIVVHAVITHYAKKDYLFGFVCRPDKSVEIAAISEDRYALIEKMLEVNPNGWPQTIVNGMAAYRHGPACEEANTIPRWAVASSVSEKEIIRVLNKMGFMIEQELVRRGLPKQYTSKTEEEFNKKTEELMKRAGISVPR